jgi:hypothetical protein
MDQPIGSGGDDPTAFLLALAIVCVLYLLIASIPVLIAKARGKNVPPIAVTSYVGGLFWLVGVVVALVWSLTSLSPGEAEKRAGRRSARS